MIFEPIVAALSDPKTAAAVAASAITTVLIFGGPVMLGGAMLLWYGVKNLRAHFRKPDEG